MQDPVLGTHPLGAPPWPTQDPFLFAVHHDDAYPAGNDRMGPAASLAVQVNGKLRDTLTARRGLPKDEAEALALASDKIQRQLAASSTSWPA